MNELDPKPLGVTSMTFGAQMTELSAKIDAAIRQTVRHQEFMVRAHAVGIPSERAQAIVDREVRRGPSFGDPLDRCEERLRLFFEFGYLLVVLDEVLTTDELRAQPFEGSRVLNGGFMSRPYGKRFAEMPQDRQRVLVKAAIELTQQLGGPKEGWPLERAMAAVMPYQEEA